MPKSFLVRMKQSMENVNADSVSNMHRGLNGNKESETTNDTSDTTTVMREKMAATEPEIIMPYETPVAPAVLREQSYIHIMKSSDNRQSNPMIAMTSHSNNQSGSRLATACHHVGPSSEIALPTNYHVMPSYYPSWYQYDWLESRNNIWCHPHHMPQIGNLPLNYTGKAVRLLHTGEVHLPLYSKDNSLYIKEKESLQYAQKLQDYGTKQHNESSDTVKFPHTLKEFFSVEQMLGTKQPEKDYKASPATAKELITSSQTHSTHRVRKSSHARSEEEQQTAQDLGKPLPTTGASISEPRNEVKTLATVSCTTRLLQGDISITAPQQSTNPEKSHVCQQCNKTFNRASNLRAHMKTHSGHKPYKCDYCGKGFHQKIDKRIHHYTHTGEKPHKCKKCGRGFKQLTHLNYHMRTHSDTHMYHCTYCGKGFNQKGNLQAHIYGHTGQRPFKCETCGKGFTLRSTLNTHLRTHAPKKPFVCEYCNKAFYQKNALKMHHVASHPTVNGKSIL